MVVVSCCRPLSASATADQRRIEGKPHHLGRTLSAKDFALAKKVFKHLVHRDAEYKDARARYRHAKTHLLAQAGISPGHGAGSSFGEGASSLPASVQETLPRQRPPVHLRTMSSSTSWARARWGRLPGARLALRPNGGDQNLALHQEFEGAALVDARERFSKRQKPQGG